MNKIKSYELKTKEGKLIKYRCGKFEKTNKPWEVLNYHRGWSRGDQEAIRISAEKEIGEPVEWVRAEHDMFFA